jgi:hypothetical protein
MVESEKLTEKSAAEGQILGDAINVGGIHPGQTTQRTAAFGILGLRQVAPARAGAQNLSASRNFETFGHGFPGLDAFGASHKILKSLLQKSAEHIGWPSGTQARIF